MDNKDQIKDIFRDKLSDFEYNVRPELWKTISSKSAVSVSGSASTSLSLFAKVIIGSVVSISAFTFYLLTTTNTSESKNGLSERKLEIETHQGNLTSIRTKHQVVPINKYNRVIQQNSEVVIDSLLQTKLYNNDVSDVQFLDEIIRMNQTCQQENTNTSAQHYQPESEAISESNELQVIVLNDVVAEEKKHQDIEFSRESLPNVFTPNGDGINDFLEIMEDDLTEFSLVVIDAKNNVVFISKDPGFKWDGRLMSGNEAPSGDYVYFFTAKDFSGELVTRSSRLLIER